MGLILTNSTRYSIINLFLGMSNCPRFWGFGMRYMGLSQNDLKEIMRGSPPLSHKAVEKKQKKREKQYTKPEGQDLPLRVCALFFFSEAYAAVGANRCVPNRPVCIL